jgi:cytoskeletal protein CcmA (bactofilin family)
MAEVSRHLASCGACRRLADSLLGEKRVLISCLQDVQFLEFELEDEILGAPQAAQLSITRFTALIFAMSVLLRPVFSALNQFQIPLSATSQFNLLVEGVMYGIPAASRAIGTFLNLASWIVISVIACIALVALFRRSPIISTMVSVLALLSVFSPWTYAIDIRRGEKPVSVPAGETIDDTMVITGDSSVDIEGTITGDLIALAGVVRLKGTVKGNLITFAERTDIDGNVEGSVLGTGGLVNVRGTIGRNLYGVAGNISIDPGSRIEGNASMLVGEASLDGSIGKDFYARTARSIGWGGRSMFSRGGEIQVLSHAQVGRNLSLKVDEKENAVIDQAATANIKGRTEIQDTPQPPSRYATASFYVWQTIWLVAAFIVGLILFRVAPRLSQINLDTGRTLLLTGGIGFIAAVVPPLAGLIAGLTLIGLPLGLMTIGLWVTALYLSKIIIAAFLGRALFPSGSHGIAVPLLAGLAVVFLAANLPFVGPVIGFLLTILGLGALIISIYRMPALKSLGSAAPLPA